LAFTLGVKSSMPKGNYPPYSFIEGDRTLGVPSVAAPMTRGAINRPGPMAPGWNLTNILPEITARAVRYIENAAKSPKPFFLYFPLTAPHYPIVPAAEFKGRSRAGDYGDFVAQVDATVGAVLEALNRAVLEANTLGIFTSDNGSECLEVEPGAYQRIREFGHRSMDGLRGVKRDTWESGHRVPFLALQKCFPVLCMSAMTASRVAATPEAASMESTPEGTATAVKSAAETACAKATAERTSAIPTKRPERTSAVESSGIGGLAVLAEGASTWDRPVWRRMDLGAVTRHVSIGAERAGAG